MQAAAERERERMSTEVDGVAVAHVEKVRTRGTAEAEELRKLAEDDITGIHAWTKAETARIREEAERRIGVRREELDGYLVRHTALIDGEVGQIDGAVEDYHRQLDAFFDRLSAETNPAEFARLADDLPEPPDLARVGADARAAAVAELAREEDAAEPIDLAAKRDDHWQGPAGDGGSQQLGAFDPGARGPELVPVMDEVKESAEAPAAAEAPAPVPDAPAAHDGAVASARMPIETVIPPVADPRSQPGRREGVVHAGRGRDRGDDAVPAVAGPPAPPGVPAQGLTPGASLAPRISPRSAQRSGVSPIGTAAVVPAAPSRRSRPVIQSRYHGDHVLAPARPPFPSWYSA